MPGQQANPRLATANWDILSFCLERACRTGKRAKDKTLKDTREQPQKG